MECNRPTFFSKGEGGQYQGHEFEADHIEQSSSTDLYDVDNQKLISI